jgi:hypothetical protein
MSTDRELLEDAAKAAGLTIHAANQAARDACGAGDVGLWISTESTCWNPLTDDGDALRLAVKLGIGIETIERYAVANVRYGDTHCEALGSDHYAATRRAIVRAAAAIGGLK